MVKYVFKRILYIIVVFFIISIVVYWINMLNPNDPVLLYMENNATDLDPERWQMLYNQTRERMGMDKPIYVRYIKWMGGILTGDFGYSTLKHRPVVEVLSSPLRNTVKINVYNLVLVFAITIPLGIRSAVKRGGVFDNTVQVITILGYSLPTFIIAILAILVFAVVFPVFKISGMSTPNFKGTAFMAFWDRMYYMTLPLLVMVFTSLGSLTRFVRGAMIDALSLDCVRTARAKGLKEKVVIYSHAFRNAQITVITVMGGWFIGIFSGSVMVERIFLWNGMGRIMVDSVFAQDYGVVFASLMFYALIGLVGHLIIDLIYGAADPRIRLT